MSEQLEVKASSGRIVIGKVISDKMDKTIVVLVERKVPHRIYKKFMKRSTKLYAHDESNNSHVGDTVSIQEVRPFSKTKTWNLVSVVEAAKE